MVLVRSSVWEHSKLSAFRSRLQGLCAWLGALWAHLGHKIPVPHGHILVICWRHEQVLCGYT